MLGFENTKRFLLSDIRKIGQKKLLLLVKLKIHFLGLMLLVTLMVTNYWKFFMKTYCTKLVKEKFRIEKFRIEEVLKKNG